ncbi:hypothetical protein HW555_001053 [Spodoptera exigua]|uniref:Peptidase A2 domain-containing protein n=1 Tax=Spodoptera exigua TaxID=7107 RepID=A0A835GPW4_SPOEX|nr:hypothetical protein HW555_001053 [Spodoptera exigua]
MESSEKDTSHTTADTSKNWLPEGNKTATPRAEGSDSAIVSCLSTGTCRDTVLLPTALVNAEAKGGTYRVIRALIDQGSQGSFITESMAQYLGLKKSPSNHLVAGVGGDKAVKCKATVQVKIQSRVNPSFNVQVKAYVLKSITVTFIVYSLPGGIRFSTVSSWWAVLKDIQKYVLGGRYSGARDILSFLQDQNHRRMVSYSKSYIFLGKEARSTEVKEGYA